MVAIRDTPPSKDNPYSTSERWTMIQDAPYKWGNLVRIIVIPDIDEIVMAATLVTVSAALNWRNIFTRSLEQESEYPRKLLIQLFG